jgi:hypothetical protein
MNFQSAIAASCLSIFLLSSPAQAAQTIVTFEDVATSATSSPLYATGDVADGYKGISGWGAAGQVWEFLDGTDFGEIGARFFYGTSGELRFDLAPVVFEERFTSPMRQTLSIRSPASSCTTRVNSFTAFWIPLPMRAWCGLRRGIQVW